MLSKPDHIVTAFDDELLALDRRVLEMGGMAEAQLIGAMEALRTRNVEKAEAIIAKDERIDDYEREIEDRTFKLLALRQPVANDLRYIFGGLKIAGSLERCGDYAKSIAKRATVLAEFPSVDVPPDLSRLADLAISRLGDVIDAYTNRDAEKASAVWKRDQQIDDFYARLMRDIISSMAEDAEAVECGAHFLFIGKNLERVGDHATNIAEVIEFQLSGSWTTEDRPKVDEVLNN